MQNSFAKHSGAYKLAFKFRCELVVVMLTGHVWWDTVTDKVYTVSQSLCGHACMESSSVTANKRLPTIDGLTICMNLCLMPVPFIYQPRFCKDGWYCIVFNVMSLFILLQNAVCSTRRGSMIGRYITPFQCCASETKIRAIYTCKYLWVKVFIMSI